MCQYLLELVVKLNPESKKETKKFKCLFYSDQVY